MEEAKWAQNRIRDEAAWTKFKNSCLTVIRFRDIPWPLGPDSNILSLSHTTTEEDKKRLKRLAQLRWHPDKFEQVQLSEKVTH